MADSAEQLAFAIVEAGVKTQHRRIRGTATQRDRVHPEWPEEQEREWRERSAVKTVLTTHVLDNPCKMGNQHYGGCWHNTPDFDAFISEIHRKRLDAMYPER